VLRLKIVPTCLIVRDYRTFGAGPTKKPRPKSRLNDFHFERAEEIFATGKYSKEVPVTRIGDRLLRFGSLYTKAPHLYWAFGQS
jgi:hypothetical protein